jgi:hypothetical protein
MGQNFIADTVIGSVAKNPRISFAVARKYVYGGNRSRSPLYIFAFVLVYGL